MVKTYLVIHSKIIIYRKKRWIILQQQTLLMPRWWMSASQKLVELMYNTWLRNIVIKRYKMFMRKIPTHLIFFVECFQVLFHNQTCHLWHSSRICRSPRSTCIHLLAVCFGFWAAELAHGKNAQLGFLSLFCPLKAIKPQF